MPRLYVIAGCNGAGKTTASFTVLPEMLNCNEFVNADMIAFGLSPFNSGNVSIAAGRIMLSRIKELISEGNDFAFETTLSTKSYTELLKTAKQSGYIVTLLFFWLASPEQAIMRVAERVKNGGHFIPDDVVSRRYHRGLQNFFSLYKNMVDVWLFFDSAESTPRLIAQSDNGFEDLVIIPELWEKIQYHG